MNSGVTAGRDGTGKSEKVTLEAEAATGAAVAFGGGAGDGPVDADFESHPANPAASPRTRSFEITFMRARSGKALGTPLLISVWLCHANIWRYLSLTAIEN